MPRSPVMRKASEGRGALEDFLTVQRELAELEAWAAALRERLKAAEGLRGEGTQLEIDRANQKARLQAGHEGAAEYSDRADM